MATNTGGWLYEANGTPVDKATADNAQARVLEIKQTATSASTDATTALSRSSAAITTATAAKASADATAAGQAQAITNAAQAKTDASTALVKATGAVSTADNAADRVDALEVMGGVQPGSVNDANMKLHAEQDGGLFNTALKAQIGAAPFVVYHGTDAGFPRPVTDRPVMWVGQAFPNQYVDGDMFFRVHDPDASWAPDWMDLLGWWEADMATPVGTAGDVVPDRGLYGVDLTKVGSTAGDVALDNTTIPGVPAWRFTGTGYLNTAGLPAGVWGDDVTVYAAFALDDIGTVQNIIASGAAGSVFGIWATVGRAINVSLGTVVETAVGVFNWGEPTVIAVRIRNGYANISVNGILVADFAPTGTQKPTRIRLSGRTGSGSPVRGVISETVVARNVTPDDHTAVTDYLMQKIGASA